MRQVGDIRALLEANGFARFAETFEENEIDSEAVLGAFTREPGPEPLARTRKTPTVER